jgi:hypothetical protein
VVDATGMELGRVRATSNFYDPELGSVPAGLERDAELTGGVLLLVQMGFLELLEVYEDPAAPEEQPKASEEPTEDWVWPEDRGEDPPEASSR